MSMLELYLDFSNKQTVIVNAVIVLFLILAIISGYKKGFLESSVGLLGEIVAIVGAYILKNPVSVFLYTHLPFFKLGGLFKGVSALNIIIYELIAFFIVLTVLFIALKVVAKITGLVDKILSFVFLLGIPSKILGALVGLVNGLVVLYFAITLFTLGANIFGYEVEKSLATNITEIPVLKNTFGPTFDAMDEITKVAKDYDSNISKDDYNKEALDIMLKYKIITVKNAEKLIDDEKIKIENSDELLDKYR